MLFSSRAYGRYEEKFTAQPPLRSRFCWLTYLLMNWLSHWNIHLHKKTVSPTSFPRITKLSTWTIATTNFTSPKNTSHPCFIKKHQTKKKAFQVNNPYTPIPLQQKSCDPTFSSSLSFQPNLKNMLPQGSGWKKKKHPIPSMYGIFTFGWFLWFSCR